MGQQMGDGLRIHFAVERGVKCVTGGAVDFSVEANMAPVGNNARNALDFPSFFLFGGELFCGNGVALANLETTAPGVLASRDEPSLSRFTVPVHFSSAQLRAIDERYRNDDGSVQMTANLWGLVISTRKGVKREVAKVNITISQSDWLRLAHEMDWEERAVFEVPYKRADWAHSQMENA
jgi:hypothetical protein